MYLVTGATGVIGRPLIQSLLADGAEIRAVTRDPRTADLPAGVEAVALDFADPEAIVSALRDVTALFVHPRAVGDATGNLLALAADQGVQRVVVMSAINVDDDPEHQPSRFNGDRNTEVERAVTNSGLPWVSVRPGSFAVNTIGMWAAQIQHGDIVRGPFPTFTEAAIHERDLAAVLARAFVDDRLLGRRIPVTGPQALTFEQMVATIGDAIGRRLRYQEVPAELAAQGMTRHGFPEQFVQALMARYAREVGRAATVTGEVEAILGRPARTYAEWANDHAHAFQGDRS